MEREKEGSFKSRCFYKGHSAKNNFDLQLKLGFTEAHVTEAIQFIAGIGKNISIMAKVGDEKAKLGTWTVYKVTFDKDLQSTVVLKSNTSFANINDISTLMAEEEIYLLAKFE